MICVIVLIATLVCGLSRHGDDLTIEEMMLIDELGDWDE